MSIALNKLDTTTYDTPGAADSDNGATSVDTSGATAAATAAVGSQVAAQQAAAVANTQATAAGSSTYSATGVSAKNLASGTTTAITSSVPELPTVPVTGNQTTATKEATHFISNFSISNSEAFRIIEQMGQKNYALDAQLTNAANLAVIGAKEQQVRDTQAQVEGDRKSAVIQFVGGMAASATGLGVGYTGRKWRDSPSETTAAQKYDHAAKATPGAEQTAVTAFKKSYLEACARGLGPAEDRSLQMFDAHLKRTVGSRKKIDAMSDTALQKSAKDFLAGVPFVAGDYLQVYFRAASTSATQSYEGYVCVAQQGT